MKKKKEQAYKRIGIFKLEEILPFTEVVAKEYNGHIIRMTSQRYRCFKLHGTTCIKCGVVGTFFALETHIYGSGNTYYHFNLYAIQEDGSEILMTKDHIIPKSKGGSNHLSNLQPMCTTCNGAKDSMIPPPGHNM